MKQLKLRKEASLGSGCKGFSLLRLQIWMGAVFLAVFFYYTAEAYVAKYGPPDSVNSVKQTLVLMCEADSSKCWMQPNSPGAK